MKRFPAVFLQTGSALTEFAVFSVVLIPMLLSVPLLGKVSDVNQATIQASRYAAWERTIAGKSVKTDTVLSNEIENRFYAKPGLGIATKQGQSVVTGKNNQNALWGGVGVSKRLVSTNTSAVGTQTHEYKTPGTVGSTLSGQITKVASTLGSFSNGNWDLDNKGFYKASINTEIKGNSVLKDGKDCKGAKSTTVFSCVKRLNAILTDSWVADSPSTVEKRVKALVPAGAFKPIEALIPIVSAIPIFKEFKGLDGAFGLVKPDVLPMDRFGDK